MKIFQPINQKALFIATVSFLLGTILLLSFLILQSNTFLDIGLFYVIIAFVFNTITLIGLIINSIINYQYYKENLITISLFLLNIPITIGYIVLIQINPLKNIIV
ncbi:hypothetical protein [Aquimarina sp. AU474]|uniref:hypothetical protein n=1 Tax=Aquimarina sp. AU474 TaxID=2108529 RepID=UPI000D688ECC|nr:hypothetical protein [Aquimarina sp. AU474]